MISYLNEKTGQDYLPHASMPERTIRRDEKPLKIIFLDIDGVLNDEGPKRDAGTVIDDKCVARLARIVETTGAKIVLSSSWREAWYRFYASGYKTCGYERNDPHLRTLKSSLDAHGLEIYDCLPSTGTGPDSRPAAIRAWLKDKAIIASFVILDDDDFWCLGWLTSFFVWCQTYTGEIRYDYPVRVRGLEDDHVEKAISILESINNICPETERQAADEMVRARNRSQP